MSNNTGLEYVIFDACMSQEKLSKICMKCLGVLVDEANMLTFVIRDDRPEKILKEKELLLDCCKLYKAIIKKMPEYKGYYGHIVLSKERIHYVEDFKQMEKELKAI